MFELEYLIYVYITLCACMMLFNIIYMLFMNSTEKFENKGKNTLSKKMNIQFVLLENKSKISVRHKEYLYRKLKRTHNLILFENILDKQSEDIKQKYINNVQYVFHDLALYYQKKDSIKKAYFAYIVGKYRFSKNLENDVLISTIYGFLDEESIYCRDNSLKTIIRLENINNIIRALKRINEINYYYYPEMILKDLLEFTGDKIELAQKMWNNFELFNENIQIAIIGYISEENLNYSKEFYSLLIKDSTNKNIKLEVIKYYRNNIYEFVKEILIYNTKLTGIENKELVIESAKTLQSYNSPETKDALKSLLKRNDWTIREVASESLIYLGTSYIELAEIYNGEDEIAREILKYKVQTHKYKYKSREVEVN